MLAQRTQKLIEELKPDTVMVQASPDWWLNASRLWYVKSQDDMNNYSATLERHNNWNGMDWYWSNRKWLFLSRLWTYSALWKWHFRFGHDFKMGSPGLEVKYACESAEKVGAKLQFLGPELDGITWQRLFHETRMNMIDYLAKRFQRGSTFWGQETQAARQKVRTVGPSAFTEKCLDSKAMNWYIQSTDAFFPRFKSIFVDAKDEDLFKAIDNTKGETVVVIVNQWHMEGIEHHWAHRYGQVPRSVELTEDINPIGDMNLREGLFNRLYNNLHREIGSKNTKGYPSTYADWIIGYHRESNWQYEHRDM